MKKNIKDMNDSLAEIEQASFNQMPTPTVDEQQVYRQQPPQYDRQPSPPQRKRWEDKISDQKSYTFNGGQSEPTEKPIVPPLVIERQNREADKFEDEFKAW